MYLCSRAFWSPSGRGGRLAHPGGAVEQQNQALSYKSCQPGSHVGWHPEPCRSAGTFSLDYVKLLPLAYRRLLVSEVLGNERQDHGTVPFLEDEAVKSRGALLLLRAALLVIVSFGPREIDVGKVRQIEFGWECGPR